jgi:hypothetical protein
MRIIEQNECVLILRSSAKDFWIEVIILLPLSMFLICVLFAFPHFLEGWWRLIISFFLLLGCCLGLQQAWSSHEVKSCHFDKLRNRITIDFHGLKPVTKKISLQEMQALEVRERAQAHYGVICKWSELWLVTRSERFFLSDTRAEEIADRVREFLPPIERTI